MNRRGEKVIWETVVHLILIVIILVGFGVAIWAYSDGAVLWEDYYAKELSRIVNSAEPGTEVYIDVTDLSRIAQRHGKDFRKDMVEFDNVNNEVKVSLRQSGGVAYGFFNDVDVVESRVELLSEGAETNRLYFKIQEVSLT